MPSARAIEVQVREPLSDPDGLSAFAAAREAGLAGVRGVRSVRGFLLPGALGRDTAERAATSLLADPVGDAWRVVEPGEGGGRRDAARVVVRRRPGVMDPVASSAARALRLLGIEAERVETYRAYEVHGEVDPGALLAFARRALGNETIETVEVDPPPLDLHADPPRRPFDPVRVPIRGADAAALERIARDGLLALSLEEMRAIQASFAAEGRDPTDVEIETIAQTWSEHCLHKTFRGRIEHEAEGRKVTIEDLLSTTIRAATEAIGAPWCLSVFRDNAGIVAFDEANALAFKVETHNHPSALEPYGGAGTGIGGVIRDVLGAGLGARPIASTDVFAVGPPDLPSESVPAGVLHPRRLLRGVVAGVRDYGNRIGIPTVNGAIVVHPGYTATPLVFCGNLGLLPRDRISKGARPGDRIVLAGGRTGRDGIHGATFSSAALHAALPGSVVQIGDPITEKKLLEAVVRARDAGLFDAITDCGAGGLSSAVGEMGADLGAEVDLEAVPLKYPGLAPAEIWISEAQERMVLSVPPDRLVRLLEIFGEEEVEATAIGRFSDSGRLVIRFEGRVVGDLDLRFLHGGWPRPTKAARWSRPRLPEPDLPPRESYGEDLRAILAAPTVASKEWVVRQYDHEVQGGSVVKPLAGPRRDAPTDAAVVAPVPGASRGVAIACGIAPRFGGIDPAAMAGAAIDEALRNAVAVGGDPARTAILDNFAWGSPDDPETLGALVRAAEACRETAIAYGTPFISGKDSLNNEFRDGDRHRAVPGTLLVSALSLVEDLSRCLTADLKGPGHLLYLVGLTRFELGGSHFYEVRGAGPGASVPRLDLPLGRAVLHAVARAIDRRTALSCHDLSEGGLAVAAAEMAFGGGVGVDLDCRAVRCEAPLREDAILFSESNSRFLLEVARGAQEAFEEAIGDVPCAAIGETIPAARLLARGLEGTLVLDEPLEALRAAWKGTFEW